MVFFCFFPSRQIEVRVKFLDPSRVMRTGKNEPAIHVGSTVTVSTGLPSIMLVDSDLVMDYFQNLAKGLMVEHNVTTGESKAILDQ